MYVSGFGSRTISEPQTHCRTPVLSPVTVRRRAVFLFVSERWSSGSCLMTSKKHWKTCKDKSLLQVDPSTGNALCQPYVFDKVFNECSNNADVYEGKESPNQNYQ